MKVQILLNNEVIATQIVSIETFSSKPSLEEVKRIALKAALEDKAIRISQSLQATFRLFEVNGEPVQEEDWRPRSGR